MKLVLYLPQIILTLVAIFIIVRCFISLFSMRPAGKPKAVLINKSTGKKLAISTYETSMGRAKSSDIQLASTMASRSHAVISRRKKGWFVTDTESKTGTFVNGEQTEGATRIYHGDIITIGGVEYTFVAPHASREDDAAAIQVNHGVTGYFINMATGYTYTIQNGRLTIGRTQGCDVVIEDGTVSQVHAIVQYTDEGWVVTDNDSKAGVGVNGYRIHGTEPINDGDQIMINTHVFVFRDTAAAERRGVRA
ncbi:MAG: FHA domain-containing protein [Clostridia bacterium]|nr:FHA domain-containing protein [Clostridia bacterium]